MIDKQIGMLGFCEKKIRGSRNRTQYLSISQQANFYNHLNDETTANAHHKVKKTIQVHIP